MKGEREREREGDKKERGRRGKKECVIERKKRERRVI